jgi:hypothetical protein
MEEGVNGAKTSGSTPLFGGASPRVERPAEQVAEADVNVSEDFKWPSPDSSTTSAPNSDSNLYDTSNSDGNEAQERTRQLEKVIGGQRQGESRKRKSVSSLSGSEKSIDRVTAPKRVRLESPTTEAVSSRKCLPMDRSLLPAEVWHHVFTFCSPSALGNLLQVNKLFNKYLDPTSSVQRNFLEKLSRTAVECLDPNLIWQISRRRFWPSTPSPYDSKTQLDMWRLAFAKRCQWCGKRSNLAKQTSHDSLRGPGREGVSVIWQFATRACGPCLAQRSLKVNRLHFQSAAHVLLTTLLRKLIFCSRRPFRQPSSQLYHSYTQHPTTRLLRRTALIKKTLQATQTSSDCIGMRMCKH